MANVWSAFMSTSTPRPGPLGTAIVPAALMVGASGTSSARIGLGMVVTSSGAASAPVDSIRQGAWFASRCRVATCTSGEFQTCQVGAAPQSAAVPAR